MHKRHASEDNRTVEDNLKEPDRIHTMLQHSRLDLPIHHDLLLFGKDVNKLNVHSFLIKFLLKIENVHFSQHTT